mgnify:CR=1 FL=1
MEKFIKFITNEKFYLPIVYIVVGLILYLVIEKVINRISKGHIGNSGKDKRKDTIINLGRSIFKYLILIFIVLLGYEIVSEVLEMIRDGQKAAFYKEMAEKDVMTGLYNRSAFEHWEQNMEDYNGYAIVTFDLNNLKYCNDNIGHAAGDAYIEASAKLIREIFGKYGKCYRIGGDEFCAIIRTNKRFNIEKYKKRLRWREKQITEKLGIVGLNVHIACGYAEYDNEKDEDFESTRSRADKKMYESKKILKKDK